MTLILIAIKNDLKIKKWNKILFNSNISYQFLLQDSDHSLSILYKNKKTLSKLELQDNSINKNLLRYKNYSISDEMYYSGYKSRREMLVKISNLLNLLDNTYIKKYFFLISPGSGSYFYATCHDYFRNNSKSAYRIIYNKQFNIDSSPNYYVTNNNFSEYHPKLPKISSYLEVKKYYDEFIKTKKNDESFVINKNRIKYRSASSFLHFFKLMIKFCKKALSRKDISYFILRKQLISTVRKIVYLIILRKNRLVIKNKSVIFYLNVYGDAQVNLRNPKFINPENIYNLLSKDFNTINFKMHPADIGGLPFRSYITLRRKKVNFIITDKLKMNKIKNSTIACLNGSIAIQNAVTGQKTLVLGKSFLNTLKDDHKNIIKILGYFTCKKNIIDKTTNRHKIIYDIIKKLINYELENK